MIQINVFYPAGDGSTFDHDYFRDTHIPLAVKTWGLPGAQILKGLNGPYVAGAQFVFESQEAVDAAFSNPATAEVMADVANYTNITPLLQTSEVVD